MSSSTDTDIDLSLTPAAVVSTSLVAAAVVVREAFDARGLKALLVAHGIDEGRINAPTAVGATTKFTGDATTDQDTEANRRGNRRVTVSFAHTASILPP